jgi:hypothetical protein
MDAKTATDRACQILNYAAWSSDAARTEACLHLALLTESEAAEGWTRQYLLRTIREILPIALRAAGFEDHAVACESAEDLEAAGRAAKGAYNAARYNAAAYNAAAYNAAAYAAYAAASAAASAAAAAYAARYTAHAAKDPDAVLRKAVQILVECRGGSDFTTASLGVCTECSGRGFFQFPFSNPKCGVCAGTGKVLPTCN